MARIRTIKPSFWTHEKLSALPEATHLLAASLLNYADDEGYFNANVGLIKAACSPLREPSVSIHTSLTELSNVGYLKLGKVEDGRFYGQIIKFSDHQVVNRPYPSEIKRLKIAWIDSVNNHGTVTDDSMLEIEREKRNRKGKGIEKESPALTRHDTKGNGHDKSNGSGKTDTTRGSRLSADWQPSPEDCQFCVSIGLDPIRTADAFRDYWIGVAGAKGYKRDWPATWRNWCRRDAEGFGSGGSRGQAGKDRRNPPSTLAAFGRVLTRSEKS